jgi:tRNA-splicing ligase RtcB
MKIWGEGLEAEAVNQMADACRLPVSLAGALMPDAHIGYSLPIGDAMGIARLLNSSNLTI